MAHHLHIESLEEMEQAGALNSKETTHLLLINIHDKLLKTHAENALLKKELGEEKLKNERLMVYLELMVKEQTDSRAELKKQTTRCNELQAENQEINRRLDDYGEKIKELYKKLDERDSASEPEPLYTFISLSSRGGLEHRRRSGSDSSSCSPTSSEISSECRTIECEAEIFEEPGIPPPKLPERLQRQYKSIPPIGDVVSSSDEDVSIKKKSFLTKAATEIKSLFGLKK